MKRVWMLLGGVVLATVGFGGAARAESPAAVPTFTKDIAPLMYDKCTSCHRPGEVAPMSLITYDDARPWAKSIKQKVQTREMPPWGADPHNSLKMRNDKSLTDEQIAKLVAWVDGGAPKGNDADMPPVPSFAEGWTYGKEPDYVMELPVDFEIPAEGELNVQMFYSKVPFSDDKFAEVLELRPGNRAVVHHAGVFIVDIPEGATIVDGRLVLPDGKVASARGADAFKTNANDTALPGASKLLSYVPGRGIDEHVPGVGKRIPAGKYINWQMHYNPTGKPERDRTRLGVWFNKVPVTHELLIRQAGDPLATDKQSGSVYRVEGKEVEYIADDSSTRRRGKTPNIPAYAENWKITGVTAVTEPITLYAMSPHMHLRGKSLKWVVTWPDGRDQTILDVPKFDFNWQFMYTLAEPLKIPAGSKITGIGVYDNSVKNKYNPAPNLEVYWSEQSWDEMYQPFTEYTVDSQDLTKTKKAQPQQPQQ